MTRTHIVALAVLAALSLTVAPSRAEDQAPADSAPKVLEPAGGCKPDGSCCAQPACAHHAVPGADKAANDAGPVFGADSNAADSGGGCPCSKMKKKAM